MTSTYMRVCGLLVAAGGIIWGAAWILRPSDPEHNDPVEIWASVPFSIGLLALLTAMWVTAATGTGRWGRGVLAAEFVAVVLALGWTLPYLVEANRPNTGILVVLDLFWPLSMLGLVVVAIFVVRARRWPTPLRYLPLAASLLLVVDLAFAWTPDRIGSAITGTYLAITYGVLGVAMVRTRVPGPEASSIGRDMARG
ncbi:hypothetical protein OHA21_15975 [Actinoplanes sp. NBC_00393]|uniref:hypothetical protein n=1 Tax=Actinoplanes sp. NBC_00393 TaxID=2975953 RepID=UPI002E1DF293